MLEKDVEQRLREEVEKIGGKAFKLVSQGNAGMPDRLICLSDGRAVFVELKRPKGGRLSKLQEYRIAELQRLGFEVRVLHTVELVDRFINEVKDGRV